MYIENNVLLYVISKSYSVIMWLRHPEFEALLSLCYDIKNTK